MASLEPPLVLPAGHASKTRLKMRFGSGGRELTISKQKGEVRLSERTTDEARPASQTNSPKQNQQEEHREEEDALHLRGGCLPIPCPCGECFVGVCVVMWGMCRMGEGGERLAGERDKLMESLNLFFSVFRCEL